MRAYLDILTGTFVVRQLQPWHENIGKRQVKAPKIYLRDSGLLHGLLGLPDWHSLMGYPRLGASWEGFVLEQVLRIVAPTEAYFWATHGGAEVDLFLLHHGRRYGVEIKFSEAPKVGRSQHTAVDSLNLDRLWIVYPGQQAYPVDDKIMVWPLKELTRLPDQMG